MIAQLRVKVIFFAIGSDISQQILGFECTL